MKRSASKMSAHVDGITAETYNNNPKSATVEAAASQKG